MGTTAERDYYTVAEAAKMLNVSHSTVWRWIRAGKLPAFRIGSRNLRVRQRDLENLRAFEPDDSEWESLSFAQRRALLLRPLSDEEARDQRELFERVKKTRAQYSIAPMTSDELVRRSRENEFWDDPNA